MILKFISGLPRSGTTLLASILRQNPAVTASFESPVGQIVTDAVTAMSDRNEAKLFISDEQRERIVRGVFENYYGRHSRWVFDNNRRWTTMLDIISKCFPGAKIIAMVRDVPAIVDSFEQCFRAGALNPSVIYGANANTTVYGRTASLMAEGGVVRFAYEALKDAYYGPHRDKLVLVEYADLARDPDATMKRITKEAALDPWDYDFEHIQQIPRHAEFDAQLSTPGLHSLQPQVRYTNRDYILPPDIVRNLPPPFWRPVKETATKAA